MKIIILIILAAFVCSPAQAEMRHTFYERYDPASTTDYTYDDTGATTTGDVVDVFTYDKKTIFISCESILSTNIAYRIEGRCVGELDTWSVLDTGDIGTASADASKNFAVDVTELVDYLRVGFKIQTGNAADLINVRGIFRREN